jgi:hypothetical protein
VANLGYDREASFMMRTPLALAGCHSVSEVVDREDARFLAHSAGSLRYAHCPVAEVERTLDGQGRKRRE